MYLLSQRCRFDSSFRIHYCMMLFKWLMPVMWLCVKSRSRSPLSVYRVLFVCTFVIILYSLYCSFVMSHSSVNLTTHGLFFHFVLSPQIIVWDKYTLYVILLWYTFCLFKFAIVFSYSYLNVTSPISDGDIPCCVEK